MGTLNKSYKITQCMTYVKLKVKVEYECNPTVRLDSKYDRTIRLKVIVKIKNGGKKDSN